MVLLVDLYFASMEEIAMELKEWSFCESRCRGRR